MGAREGPEDRMRLALCLLFLALPAHASTLYHDLALWQAAVGAHQIEDFEASPEVRLPIDGGSTDFGAFAVENDDQGDNEWTGLSGLYVGNDFVSDMGAERVLIISTEPFDVEEGYGGPTFIDAVFDAPIIAFGLDYAWCEDIEPDEGCSFTGFVLDAPATRVSLTEPLHCEHSWCAVDAIRWVPVPFVVPEPGTGLLVAIGVACMAWRRRAARGL
jgi:hypothetical protein